MTEVRLASLEKIYRTGSVHAVRGIDLTVAPGELLCLLGPSGCGKTTVLKMIAGLEIPSAGDVRFDDVSVLSTKAERRQAVMVFQDHLLFPYMTVGENVAFGLRMRRIGDAEIRRRVGNMLSMVQLEGMEARSPAQLSGGQRQRVALARALVVEPRVLLLDEPLSSLDESLRDEMRELICRLQRELSVTTVFVTHNQDEAVQLADRIALMFSGELAQLGSARDFYERPATKRVAGFFGNRNVFAGHRRGGLLSLPFGEFRLACEGAGACPEGPVDAFVRPEAVEISCEPPNPRPATEGPGRAGDSTAGPAIPGRIVTRAYLGTFVRYVVDAGGTRIEVRGNPVQRLAEVGSCVWLRIPPDKIWTIPSTPATEKNES